MARPPLLILAVGNPSRGDDALGPTLLEQLAAAGLAQAGDVELLTDFQLQIEHALDLEGRRAVLFVDAAHPGAAAGATLQPLPAATHAPAHSHALTAPEVLQVARQLGQSLPSAWQLALEGRSFGLGEGLSPTAQQHLAQGLALVRHWLHQQRSAIS